MKNRQLMRLNKVLHKGEVKTVDCIAPGFISFMEDRPEEPNKFGVWIDLDEVEFIPLTEEILFKCGFVLNKEKTLFEIGNSGLRLMNISNLYFRANFPIKPDIINLHQLQNLYFALTGKELEVSL